MKTVLTNHEIFHAFIHGPQTEARTSNGAVFFDNDTIFSYGSHYPLGRKVTNQRGDSAVLVNISTEHRGGSTTTSRHRSLLQRAIPSRDSHFEVDGLSRYSDTAIDHNENVAYYIRCVSESVAKAKRARLNGDFHRSNAARSANAANAYATFFGLALPFGNVAELEAEIATYTAKQAEMELVRQAELVRKAQDDIDAWIAGGSNYRPLYGVNKTFLRVNGDKVETSKGVEFPVTHALKGLVLIEACRSAKREYKRNGHTLHLGVYAIDSIDIEGNVKAGCHYVEYSEVSRIAAQIKLAVSALAVTA